MTAKRQAPKFLALAAALVCAGAAQPGFAQTYPTKPIRLLLGYSPGGPTDVTARLLAPGLNQALGQPIVIDNRPGAGGTLAVNLLVNGEPDGHTLMLVANGEIGIAPNLYRRLPYDPRKDIAPISRVGASQLVLVVHPSVPAKSVADLVELARAKPGSLNFASSGLGTTAHLAAEYMKHLAKIDIVHVPYKGAGPALTDLMGGQVQMLISGYSSAIGHVKAGKLRALGVTGAKRLRSNPDLPTIGETVKGYEVTSWYGIAAPRRTPAAIIARLHKEIAAIVNRPELAERMAALGIEPEGTSPQVFRDQIRSEIAKWGQVVKIAKVPQQ
ncbi:MAG: tripartite tricarboxylate transporter substrate binding protein [Phycisphaerales bacterium]|nr:tripartite tricarboxylate transporter substrate binding protein [Phycisphaerales bacterium]